MLDRIAQLREQADAEIAGAKDSAALEEARVRHLGRKAELPNLLRHVADLPPEERGAVGRAANEARRALEGAIDARRAELEAAELEQRLAADVLDVTLPGSPVEPIGRLHLITATRREIEDVFLGLGFTVVEGPESDLVYYNFDALNHTPQHPARLESDTFYLSDDVVLRTHTSPMQVRAMEQHPPPLYLVIPGRTYRRDNDRTHTPQFHQVEGLAVDEDVPLLLTIFDWNMADQVAGLVPPTQLTSLADIVAPSLAGPCVDERFAAVTLEDGKPVGLVEKDDDVVEEEIPRFRPRRVEDFARALFTPYDKSAGMLLFGALGLIAIFLIETVTAYFTLDESLIDATYGSAKTLVTVDPNQKVAEGPGWYKLFISATMLVALGFAAAFTAGLVNRVVERRLTGLFGRRAVPRRGHVVVVGLGQVGMRLCLLLRACKIPLVAVESDENAESVGIAKELGLPVVIGRGADPSLMRRLSLPRARAVAAVTSNDLDNISVAMTARGIHSDVRTVLRVGDGNIANETRSLLALGLVRDVNRLAATMIASKVLDEGAESIVCLRDCAHLRFPDGRLEPARLDALA